MNEYKIILAHAANKACSDGSRSPNMCPKPVHYMGFLQHHAVLAWRPPAESKELLIHFLQHHAVLA